MPHRNSYPCVQKAGSRISVAALQQRQIGSCVTHTHTDVVKHTICTDVERSSKPIILPRKISLFCGDTEDSAKPY